MVSCMERALSIGLTELSTRESSKVTRLPGSEGISGPTDRLTKARLKMDSEMAKESTSMPKKESSTKENGSME